MNSIASNEDADPPAERTDPWAHARAKETTEDKPAPKRVRRPPQRKVATPVSPRSAAALAVTAVLAGRSLDDVLPNADEGLAPGDRGLLRALAYGVLREHLFLAAIAGKMLKSPLTDEPQIAALIEVGLFQLRSMRVSPHAAVSETVEACTLLGKPERRPLVNALLRRYQRDSRALELAAAEDTSRRYSYPTWMVDSIRCDWPNNWEQVLAGGNEQGPMTLRVNRRLISRDDYAAKLRSAGLVCHEIEGLADALRMDSAVGVEKLPGFAQGEVSVQDASAQRAVDLLQLSPGLSVLDACSAPGGKTAHILERADVSVLALDSDAARLERVKETLTRLQLSAQTQAYDAGRFRDRWDGSLFDRILLDAPCSGTGVIRRHPDIK